MSFTLKLLRKYGTDTKVMKKLYNLVKRIALISLNRILYIPYFTQVFNPTIPSVCFKSREYKITNAQLLAQFHLVYLCPVNVFVSMVIWYRSTNIPKIVGNTSAHKNTPLATGVGQCYRDCNYEISFF